MSIIHDLCDKLRSYASYPSDGSKEPESLKNVSFLYALKQETIDEFYWGYTSSLTARIQKHLSGGVVSTREEAKNGRLLLLLTVPFLPPLLQRRQKLKRGRLLVAVLDSNWVTTGNMRSTKKEHSSTFTN